MVAPRTREKPYPGVLSTVMLGVVSTVLAYSTGVEVLLGDMMSLFVYI